MVLIAFSSRIGPYQRYSTCTYLKFTKKTFKMKLYVGLLDVIHMI